VSSSSASPAPEGRAVQPRVASRLLLVVVAVAAGCRDPAPKPVGDSDAARPSIEEAGARAQDAPADAAPEAEAVRTADATAPLAFDCEDGAPRSGKSVGHTSVVFKLELTNGKKVAWKPNAKKVRGRWRGEVAAWRLGEALGLPNVPLACARTFDAAAIGAALAPNADASKLFADEAIVEGGKVRGAIIPWIDGLQFWPLEKEPVRAEVQRWLKGANAIPEDKLDLARQASTLVAFDFLTSNWDRYSGGNVGLDATGKTVLFIDNDAAFTDGPPREQLARNRTLVDGVDRFSRGFVAKVRELGDERLGRVFGEAGGGPLLPEPVLLAFAKRRAELLAIVDAKAKRSGDAETFFFP
jgi:hypothetical protein